MAQQDSWRKWRNNSYHTKGRSYIPRFKSVQSKRTSCLLSESFDALLKSSVKISNHRGWQTIPLLPYPPWKRPCDTEADSSAEFLGWVVQMGWPVHTLWGFFSQNVNPIPHFSIQTLPQSIPCLPAWPPSPSQSLHRPFEFWWPLNPI